MDAAELIAICPRMYHAASGLAVDRGAWPLSTARLLGTIWALVTDRIRDLRFVDGCPFD